MTLGRRQATAEAVHRRPVPATDARQQRQHRPGRVMRLELSRPGVGRPGQVPDRELPAALDAIDGPAAPARAASRRGECGVVSGDVVADDVQHRGGLDRVGLRRRHGGEVERIGVGAGRRLGVQCPQVRGQRRERLVRQRVTGHQVAEGTTVGGDAIADRGGETGLGVGRSARLEIRHVRHREIGGDLGRALEEIAADDRRHDDRALRRAKAAAAVTADTGGGRALDPPAPLALAHERRTIRQTTLAVDPLARLVSTRRRGDPGAGPEGEREQHGGHRAKDRSRRALPGPDPAAHGIVQSPTATGAPVVSSPRTQ